ncbi:MAG: SprT-like domain-containing protein [Brevinema sp.]
MILNQALEKVNREYFSFTELPEIKISQGQGKIKRKAIVFGTYHTKKNEIRIHPILLEKDPYALEFVIYHELLHYQDRKELLVRKKGDRVHTKEFKVRETQFLYYDKAQKILKECLYGKSMKKNDKKKSKSGLQGEALEVALSSSLQRLEHVLIKYNMIKEKTKGVKRGTEKKNDKI